MLNADFALGMAVPVVQLALLAILVRRRLYDRFLFFSIYNLYSITATMMQLWAMMGYSFEARLTAAAAFWFDPAVLFLEALTFLYCIKLSLRKHHLIRWSGYSFGILVGFGLASFSTFLTYMARFKFGSHFEFYFHHLLPLIYFAAAVVWLIAFLRPEPPTEPWSPDRQKFQQHQSVADEGWDDAEQARRRLRKWWRFFNSPAGQNSMG
jgi:hypothetical protein